MKNFLMNIWQDESGAETVEWIVIVALLVAVAIALYDGVLQGELETLITNIGTDLGAL
jgi:pilus assembly protein Flp/PilA